MNIRLSHVKNWPELAQEVNWSVTGLARRCGVSGDTLRRHFLQHLGRLPGDWLAEIRQHQAVMLLREGASIKETAFLLGYKQQTNFTRKFKAYWGTCPTLQTRINLTATKACDNVADLAGK